MVAKSNVKGKGMIYDDKTKKWVEEKVFMTIDDSKALLGLSKAKKGDMYVHEVISRKGDIIKFRLKKINLKEVN